MDLAQKYVYSVYQNGSFSKAARKLFISQPSLSAMVKKLETELGFLIFDRSKSPLALTPEGEIYIEYIDESIEKERIMQQRVRAIGSVPFKELSVGGNSFLAGRVFPKVCADVIRRMPKVNIKMDIGSGTLRGTLKDKIEQGALDIALAYTYDPHRFDAIPIFEERFYLVLRKDVPNAERLIPYSVSIEDVLSGNAMEEVEDEKALHDACIDVPMLRRRTIPALDLKEYIDDFKVSNCSLWNASTGEFWYNYMLEGLGADIASDVIIGANKNRSADVIFVPINMTKAWRSSYIIYKKGSSLSKEAKEFVAVLKEMCSDREKFFNILLK